MQQEYSEERFLKTALEAPAFRRFYDALRPKIRWPVHWVVNPEVLPRRVHGCTDHHLGECAVILRRLPDEPLGIHVLAHEMGHLMLDSEGFPGTDPLRPRSPEAYLSTHLTSCLQDPVIEGRLGAFGFDAVDKYKRWSRDALEDMIASRAAYGDDLPFELRTERMLLVLKHRFWWKAIAGDEQDCHFWQEVQSEFPDLANDASYLEVSIEKTGFADAGPMSAALSQLRHELHLGEIVSEPHPRL